MRPDLGVAIAQNAGARLDQSVAGDGDVVDFVTDVMHAAGGVALKEPRDRGLIDNGG